MKPASFIFNWISNINLLSFTGPFMSSSLPSKLFRGGIKGFACPLHYSSRRITRPQPAWSNKTGMEILQKNHSPHVLINFLPGETPFNFSPHFAKKRENVWRWECSDAADCMQIICFKTETVSCRRLTVQQGYQLLSCDWSRERRMFSGWSLGTTRRLQWRDVGTK